MSNLPTTTTNGSATGLVPFAELERMAVAIARSNLFGIKTPDQAIALMLIAQAEGRHPAIVARDYDIISGRPAKKAEAMLRDFLAAGGSVEWHKLDATVADATFSHPQGGNVRITWSMADEVRQAGLGGKENYRKYPRSMLRSRCVSEGVRTVCPTATSGLHVPEEVQDFDDRQPAAAVPQQRKEREIEQAHTEAVAIANEGLVDVTEAVVASTEGPSPEEIAAVETLEFDSLQQAKSMRQSTYRAALRSGWSDDRMRLWLAEKFEGRGGLRLLKKSELQEAWARFKHAPPPTGARAPIEFADVPPGLPEGEA